MKRGTRGLVLRGLTTLLALVSPTVLAAQPSPAAALRSLTANNGIYSNTIPRLAPPRAYVEVCFKPTGMEFETHLPDESTIGGTCRPGDAGWIIEQDERPEMPWEEARLDCLQDGMRLPEPIEWKYSCKRSALFGLTSTTDDWEWASNTSFPMETPETGVGSTVLGDGTCAHGSYNWVGRGDGLESSEPYRCAR